jgi:hypothetical protein
LENTNHHSRENEVFLRCSALDGAFVVDDVCHLPVLQAIIPLQLTYLQWVVVSKNPCLSTGDMRILRAVDYKQLYHYVDVIVFPKVGPRSVPDQIAGIPSLPLLFL